MNSGEVLLYAIKNWELLCVVVPGFVVMGIAGFAFMKIMEPIDKQINRMESYLKERKADEAALERARQSGIVLDQFEKERGKRAKPINSPARKNDNPKELK